jgi:hypothetical protein
MVNALFKLFVTSFYKANAGFFLFFFFIFFGTVNGGTLISYHASLLTSILGSWEIMSGVFFFWILYEIKCLLFILRIANSQEGTFLYNLQALSLITQVLAYAGLQVLLYAPILFYSIFAMGFGLKKGYTISVLVIGAFQVLLIACGSYTIYKRMNNWLRPASTFALGINLPKPFFSYLLHHFFTGQKLLLVGLKIFSVLLLYVVLVRNAGKADNDSFLLFYLLILLAHFIIPFLSVQFFENELAFFRNLPLPRVSYALAYLVTYIIILLPEMMYLALYGRSLLSFPEMVAYYTTGIASLALLTAVQYAEAMDREEYVKVGFAVFFVSIFMLHSKAFIFWITIQFLIGLLLFWTGFYKYERHASQSGA